MGYLTNLYNIMSCAFHNCLIKLQFKVGIDIVIVINILSNYNLHTYTIMYVKFYLFTN